MNGHELRQLRTSLGMSQAAFGELIGVSRDFVGQMERGAAPISYRTHVILRGLKLDPREGDDLPSRDPMERMTAAALRAAGIPFEFEARVEGGRRLDFYLPTHDVYIEVKRFHSDRIAQQMAGAENVIAVQGIEAVRFLCRVLAPGFAADEAAA